METIMRWTHCRFEGCRRKLPAHLEVYGFCDAEHLSLHQEEKEFYQASAIDEISRMDALEAFKREGEPNGGKKC